MYLSVLNAIQITVGWYIHPSTHPPIHLSLCHSATPYLYSATPHANLIPPSHPFIHITTHTHPHIHTHTNCTQHTRNFVLLLYLLLPFHYYFTTQHYFHSTSNSTSTILFLLYSALLLTPTRLLPYSLLQLTTLLGRPSIHALS